MSIIKQETPRIIQQPELARLPKLCGADVELGNFMLGVDRYSGTGYEASRALLREIEGLPHAQWYQTTHHWFSSHPRSVSYGDYRSSDFGEVGYDVGRRDSSRDSQHSAGGNSQDWGRKFFPQNGGCAYIDLNHLELCMPEVVSAYDHVGCYHAMLRIARRALVKANEKHPKGQKIQVLVNNSDGQDNSYGSHLDFLITRRAWENLFVRKMHHLLWLASFQVSSLIFTGAGKVGSENGQSAVPYQISQRADFFETLIGLQTTFARPIVNQRDEALCGQPRYGEMTGGEARQMARLHVIFYDNTLCQTSSFLKVGVMQIILAMLEAEQVNPHLILDDPLETVVMWSHDSTLSVRARMVSGTSLSALELQMLFLEEAKRFIEAGGCQDIVPHADEIVALWADTLQKLWSGDLAVLASRLDWVLKLGILERAMQQHPELTWESPQLKHLDHLYSSLDPNEGFYWIYERNGFVERLVTDEQIQRFMHTPPEDTRAFTRAMLLRKADPDAVDQVDWDCIKFKLKGKNPWGTTYRTLDLANPLAFTRAQTAQIFQQRASLEQTLDALEASQIDKEAHHVIARTKTDH